MKIRVLGTGTVECVIGARFAALGHKVTIGTRDADALLASTAPNQITQETFADWHAIFVSGKTPRPRSRSRRSCDRSAGAT